MFYTLPHLLLLLSLSEETPLFSLLREYYKAPLTGSIYCYADGR